MQKTGKSMILCIQCMLCRVPRNETGREISREIGREIWGLNRFSDDDFDTRNELFLKWDFLMNALKALLMTVDSLIVQFSQDLQSNV